MASSPGRRLARSVKGEAGPLEAIEIFTAPKLVTMLDVAERELPAFYPLILVMARTGLRLGEALTLQVGDLDFTRRELWVRRSRGSDHRRHGERAIGTPKDGRQRRVDMSQQLCEVLQARLAMREAEGILSGQPVAAGGWLFPLGAMGCR